MITELLKKWFGLPLVPACNTCDVLRDMLEKSEVERRELLLKLLDREKPEPAPVIATEELKPIKAQFVPWRVRQQMLEQEDRVASRLMKDKEQEISQSRKSTEDLEKELGIQ